MDILFSSVGIKVMDLTRITVCLDNSTTIFIATGGGIFAFVGVRQLRRQYLIYKEKKELDAKRTDRQISRAETLINLEAQCKFGPVQSAIVALPFNELVQKLQSCELKAREVLEAVVGKSIRVTKEFNCITEFVPHIFEKAEELDALQFVKGPLHGIPFCVKDDHDIQGMDTTLGYSKNLNKPANRTCNVVQILKDAGAIPFCKTNVPQTLFSYGGSDNPIFGETLNPLNKLLSPGGSSSGTGCLVSAGGSPFGTGSDFGGSIRIPAHFCGITTLRHTVGRISDKGVAQLLDFGAGNTGVSGIMSPTVTTLSTIFKILTAKAVQNKYDPFTAPLPWNSDLYESKQPLRIGYFKSIPYFPALGDTPQTVLNAKKALETLGHKLVEFQLAVDSWWYIMDVFGNLLGADGGNQIYLKLTNDRISFVAHKFLVGRALLSRLYIQITSIVNFFWKSNKRITGHFSANPDVQKTGVFLDYLARQKKLKYEMLQRMEDLKLDLIICPVLPFPASRIKDLELLPNAAVYTATWSLVDFPAGVVQFGKESCFFVDAIDDQGDRALNLVKKGLKLAKDMPIGVQVIGKPFQEEMVLRVMTQLEEFKVSRNCRVQ